MAADGWGDLKRSARLLVISEHPPWRAEQRSRLETEGYVVDIADPYAVLAGTVELAHVAVVDLDLPHALVLELCAALRRDHDVPILGVAPRDLWDGDELDAVADLVDQLAPTPVRGRELSARVGTLLRRCPDAPVSAPPEPIVAGSIALDHTTRVAMVDGARVSLTQPEFDVLQSLLTRPGRVVTREELAVPNSDGDPDRALDTVVRRVRSKLESVEGTRRIVAVRGVGFRLLQDA